jgi:hypothetical protein
LTEYTGLIIDRDYRKTAASVGFTIDKVRGDDLARFPIERARLRSIWYFMAISITCTVGDGWAVETTTVLPPKSSLGEYRKGI